MPRIWEKLMLVKCPGGIVDDEINDLKTKANNARKFIEKGDKVKVTLRFRGRELAHVNASKYILDDFAKALEDVATIDKKPKFEGRSMTMFLAPKNN
jgi:translation initiation factor IF-3